MDEQLQELLGSQPMDEQLSGQWMVACRMGRIFLERKQRSNEAEMESNRARRAFQESELESHRARRGLLESELEEAEASRARVVLRARVVENITALECERAERARLQEAVAVEETMGAIRAEGMQAEEISLQELRNEHEALEERLAREKSKTEKLEANLATETAEIQARRAAERQEVQALRATQMQGEHLMEEALRVTEGLDNVRQNLLDHFFDNAMTQADRERYYGAPEEGQ